MSLFDLLAEIREIREEIKNDLQVNRNSIDFLMKSYQSRETLSLFCQFCDLFDDLSGLPRREIDVGRIIWQQRHNLFDKEGKPMPEAIATLVKNKHKDLRDFHLFMADQLEVKVQDFDNLFAGIFKFLGKTYIPLKNFG